MDALEIKGLIVKETRHRRLGNSLVVVAAKDSVALQSSSNLTNAAIQRLALGDPKTVPAGTYAKAWLEKSGLWPSVQGKVIPCESVRAVLAAVESGNVDAGVVYKTDAAISREVRVVFEVPAAEAPKIFYPAALLKGRPSPERARKFLDYLMGDAAGVVFAQHGFALIRANSE